jgi:hypothetical protein
MERGEGNAVMERGEGKAVMERGEGNAVMERKEVMHCVWPLLASRDTPINTG